MPILGIMASAILKKITDLFNRTTSGSLGNANTGQTWLATRGVWYANGSQAVSTDTASTYPLASIAFNSNTTVSASVSEGTGVAYWTTDANNWYATIAYHTQTTYSCGCSTCCSTCTHTGGTCGNSYSCPSGGTLSGTTCNTTTYSCPSGGTLSGTTCNVGSTSTDYFSLYGSYSATVCAGDGGTYSKPNCTFPPYSYAATSNSSSYAATATPITCTNSDCAACGSYSCGCSTCYNDYYWMRMLKSVSGTVSLVVSDYSIASLPAAIKVITNGGTITEYAYSDTAMTTLLGSTSVTPSSPTIGNKVGIIKAPAAVTQGTIVDNFLAQ